MEQIYNIAGIISVILLAVAAIVAIKNYSFFSKNERWYIYYICFIFLIELLSYTISFFEIKGGKSFLYPIYIAGEFFVVTGIFIKKLNLSHYYFFLSAFISLFFLAGGKILLSYQYDDDHSKAISNLIIIFLAAFALLREIKEGNGKDAFLNIDKMIFLYFSASIFIFLFQHQLLKFSPDYTSTVWVINNLLICILYSFIIYTFVKLKK